MLRINKLIAVIILSFSITSYAGDMEDAMQEAREAIKNMPSYRFSEKEEAEMKALIEQNKPDAEMLENAYECVRAAEAMAIDQKNLGNALNFTDEEKAAYKQTVKDMLTSIPGNVSNDEIDKLFEPGYQKYVFVSFSLPENTFREIMHEAEKENAEVVLCGLIDRSIAKTAMKVASTFGVHTSITIDPTLCKRYGVTVAPTMVFTEDKLCDGSAESCGIVYDKVEGNTTLKYAFEQIKESGKLRDKL